MWIVIILIVCVAYLAYKWGTYPYDCFEKQGIKNPRPLPFIGNSKWLFGRKNIILIGKEYYDQFPNERIIGLFNLREPFYMVRDPELIKHLTIKEFNHFGNHMAFVDVERDEISSNMLGLLKDQKWKEMRSALSPAFTGSKMRMMFELVSEVGQRMTDHFIEEHSKNGLIPLNMKDVFSRFTNDVIASCAFGINCDSFRNPNNEFFKIGQHINRFTDPIQMMKIMVALFFPRLAKLLGLRLFPKKLRKIFNGMIIENMKKREEENIYRPDMIQLLMQLRQNELKETDENGKGVNDSNDVQGKTIWTDNEIIAQCYMFFQAGFETVSGTLKFVAYELATNLGVQEKLLEEIDQIHQSLEDRPITYDHIHQLKYLELVILESLRLWPPIFVTERECADDFVYRDDTGLKFKIQKGSFIWIPIQALHMDEKYFPDPEKFIPERFEDDSKQKFASAYMPFGVGPRDCIATRFAMMEMKIALYHLLLKFKFEVCPETQVPLQLKKSMAGLVLQKEVSLFLTPRVCFS